MKPPKSRSVREPIQVYMDADERRILDQLSDKTGLSRAEILRQGLRSFAAAKSADDGPMQAFMRSLSEKPMPARLASSHDDFLDAAYRDTHEE